jgi:hypothetical protein
LSDEQEKWLAKSHHLYSHQELADQIGCCVDTLKRILMRRDLQFFPGAKYQSRAAIPTWSRPCQNCGCTKLRPKFQYRCNTCHEREEDDDFFDLSSCAGSHKFTTKNQTRSHLGA